MYYFVDGELMHCDELYHHGILGMKWGRRRYQKENGSYTDAGENRREKKPWFKRLQKENASDTKAKNKKRNSGEHGKKFVKKVAANPTKALLVGAGVAAGAVYLNKLNKKQARDILAKQIYKNTKTAIKVGKGIGKFAVKAGKSGAKLTYKGSKGAVSYGRKYIRGVRKGAIGR